MILAFDEFEFDAESLELRRDGAPVKSDALLSRILAVLIERPGQLITKEHLVLNVWGARSVTDNAVTVAMARLRKLLGHERNKREFIMTLHGRGYRFVRHVTRRERQLPALSPVVGERVTRAPFVGRDRLMKHLRGALSEARDGRGSSCILLGEPGIGKTRALEILANEATEAGIPVAWGYCREVGDTPPLWPFAQLVRDLLAKVPLEGGEGPGGRVAPQLKRLLPDLVESTGLLHDGGTSRPSQVAKYKVFDATARVLTMAARQTSCVLILDDLHRADPASLELLRYMIDELALTRIALYGTVRSTSKLHLHLNAVLGHRNVARIELEPLSETDVASYVAGVMHEPNPELAHAVFVKSEGNPFLMSELIRHVRERDSVDLSKLPLPDAALELVRQRLATLDESARNVLARAAVIGRHFEFSVLQALEGWSSEALMSVLDEALTRGIITADPNAQPALNFGFAHELLRSALYDGLSPQERRTLHLKVAEALEQRQLSGDCVPSADLAYHYRLALPTSNPRKVVEYCRAAAKEAAYIQSFGDAARYLSFARSALDLVPDASPRLRMNLLLQQVSYTQTVSHRAFEPLVREAIEVARAQRSGRVLAQATLLLDPYCGSAGPAAAAGLIEEALQLLPEEDIGARAALLARRAAKPPFAFDAALANAELEQAAHLAQVSGDPLALFLTRIAELYLKCGPDQRRKADQLIDEIERMSRNALSMNMQPVLRESYRAVNSLQDGDLVGMNAAIERGEAYCRHVDTDRRWHFERFKAMSLINLGDRAQGAALLEALLERGRRSTSEMIGLMCAHDECVVLERASARPKHVWRDAFAPNSDDPPNVWALKVRSLTAVGLHDEALELLAVVPPRRLSALPHDRDYLGTLGALARAVLALGEADYAAALRPLLERYPHRFAANTCFLNEGTTDELASLLGELIPKRALGA